MSEEKLKICPNGFHSNGSEDCSCGEKVAMTTPEEFLNQPGVKHTLRLVPSSQRELFISEMENHLTTLTSKHQEDIEKAVEAEREKWRQELNELAERYDLKERWLSTEEVQNLYNTPAKTDKQTERDIEIELNTVLNSITREYGHDNCDDGCSNCLANFDRLKAYREALLMDKTDKQEDLSVNK